MISFRDAHPALVKGGMEIVEADDAYISFVRAHAGTRLFCAFNLSNGPRPVAFPQGTWRLDRGAPFKSTTDDRGTILPPWQACFALAESG
jgi:alpha-glucosidase